MPEKRRTGGTELMKSVAETGEVHKVVITIVGALLTVAGGSALALRAVRGQEGLVAYVVLTVLTIFGGFLMAPRWVGWLVKKAPLPKFLRRDPPA